MLIYLPLEHIEGRYTTHLDKDIVTYLNSNNIQYKRIYPDIPINDVKEGHFLNAASTIKFKTAQLSIVAKMYEEGSINSEDTIFCSDIWFPGIESIAYLNYFCKKDVKLTGILHAGSFTDTDFVRDFERWAKNFEDVIFDISNKIFVASDFIKKDVLKKRLICKSKLVVSGLPLDTRLNEYITNKPKENIVIFNGRNVDEKQPWFFDQLSERLPDVQFINTQKLNLTKQEYYKLLSRSKVVVSYALQENFGFGINEAVYLGCTPVVPNRLVYPELYPDKYLFNTFEESVSKVEGALIGVIEPPTYICNNPFKIWFKDV